MKRPTDWLNDFSDRAERVARARRKDPETFRHNRIARQNFEPFVVSLAGREALYCEKSYCVVRVAQVFTDDWGFEAIAVPLFGFRLFDYHPEPLSIPWTFGGPWASKYLSGSTMGGGMFGWRLTADDDLIGKLRTASLRGQMPYRKALDLVIRYLKHPPQVAPSCPWLDDPAVRKWRLNQLGDIVYYVRPPELGPPYEHREVKPFEHLRATKMFFIGYSPSENLNEFAFRALLKEPDAGDQFYQLASHPSAYAAKMYGVLGLKLLKDFRYLVFQTLYRRAGHPVRCKRPNSQWRYIDTSEIMKLIDTGAIR